MGSALPCRKELKDPDQLYNTLKNLLAQIKVCRVAVRSCAIPPAVPGRGRPGVPGTALPGLWAQGRRCSNFAPLPPDSPQRVALHGAGEEVGGAGLL